MSMFALYSHSSLRNDCNKCVFIRLCKSIHISNELGKFHILIVKILQDLDNPENEYKN